MQNLVDFLSYFVQEWLGTHSGWYEGLELYKPSHNNALEATNNVIKDGDTFRESLVLPKFLVVATNIVLNWSRRRDPTSENNKAFKTKTTISNTQWKAGYEWARLNKPIIKVKCEYCELLDDCSNTIHYYVSASDQASITNNDVNEYKVSFREAN